MFRYFLLVLVWFAVPGFTFAHGLGAEAKLKDGRVHLEAYFDDDTPAADARVVVHSDGQIVAEGKTDSQGKWVFPIPAPGKVRITVDAGAGHRTTTTLTIASGSGTGSGNGPNSERVEVVSEGLSRKEFTTIPWRGLGVGVGLLGLVAAGSWAMSRRRLTLGTSEKRSASSA